MYSPAYGEPSRAGSRPITFDAGAVRAVTLVVISTVVPASGFGAAAFVAAGFTAAGFAAEGAASAGFAGGASPAAGKSARASERVSTTAAVTKLVSQVLNGKPETVFRGSLEPGAGIQIRVLEPGER